MRKVVTEESDGHARILFDGETTPTWCDEIWGTASGTPLGSDPGSNFQELSPPPGGTRFRMVTLPPDAEIRRQAADGSTVSATDEVDEEGFHRTTSIDYVYLVDGSLELVLDDGVTTVINAGDTVVQRHTNHAWRNHGTEPVRMLVVMVSIE